MGYIDGACSGFSCKDLLNDLLELRDSVNDFSIDSPDGSMYES